MGGGGVLPTNKQNKKTASKMCDVHASSLLLVKGMHGQGLGVWLMVRLVQF